MGVYSGVTQDNITVQGGTLYDVTVQGGSSSGFIVPFVDISGRKYGSFWSTQAQSLSANTPTAVTLNNSASFNTGVTLVANSQVTFSTSGIYLLVASLQFLNVDSQDHDAYFWYRKNNVDIPASATSTVVPKTGDGGKAYMEVSIIESITAGQHIEVITMVEDADVSIEYIPASAGPPVVPAIPSLIFNTHRIA